MQHDHDWVGFCVQGTRIYGLLSETKATPCSLLHRRLDTLLAVVCSDDSLIMPVLAVSDASSFLGLCERTLNDSRLA